METDSYRPARQLYDTATICDITLPFGGDLEGREDVLDRYFNSGITFVSLTVGSDEAGTGATIHNIGDVQAMICARSDRMMFVRSVDDIRIAKQQGKLALGFHFQGSMPLESNPNLVGLFHDLGVRHMLLVYNTLNAAASGCLERIDPGISRYGLRLVEEMNRVGMIVDCTHTGYRATMDIMEASNAPVIFSHSNARGLYDHPRNIADDQAVACAKTGGVVGVTGVGKFLSKRGTTEISDLVSHIRYYADLIGPQHIALGIDHVYFLEQLYRKVAVRPGLWPKGNPPPPWHYFAPEQVAELSDTLLDSGFSNDDTRGILGENFLRVAKEVWR